jgi:hypothetical protein
MTEPKQDRKMISMRTIIVAVLLLALFGCGSDVHYKHVVITHCNLGGLDVQLPDVTLRHYDIWNFSMPTCDSVPQNVDVELYLYKDWDNSIGRYNFGWVRKIGG